VGTNWTALQREHLFFTWSAQRKVHPFEIVSARGARFEVAGGDWKWDLESQVFNVNAGHGHPHIGARMAAQCESITAAAPNVVLPVRAELGVALRRLTGLHKAFLTTGGAEAVENAVKIARLVTGRPKVITRRASYHGATLATLALGGDARKAPFARWLAPAVHIDDPYPPRAPEKGRASDWVESLEAVLAREGPERVAAVLLEGLTGTNGIQMPPVDFWPRVRALCDAHGILLIDDEVFSGFGRTGRWFAREHWEVPVDLMVIGKGMTSGYAPLAGVMVSERIARHFDDEKLWCGLTHYAHPMCCAAALGSIEVLEREGLVENARRVGEAMTTRLRAIAAAPAVRGIVRDVRGLGLMQLVELDRPAEAMHARLWERGAYAGVYGTRVMLCPPLCLTAAELDEVMDVVEAALVAFAASV
jgi:taurine--2-oxoglutarate transaminase